MKVMLADVDEVRLEAHRARLAGAGAHVASAVVDVGDPGQVESLADAAEQHLGPVDVICNNAGIVRSGYTWELSLADWDAVLRVNLMGVVHGIRTFVPRMLARGGEGHVVNVSSMSAVVPVLGINPYNASKAAVLSISEILQDELVAVGSAIGVTVVMPGRVITRLGKSAVDPEDADAEEEIRRSGVQLLEPDDIGRQTVAAIRSRQLHLFTHPGRVPDAVARFARITGGVG
jgi:NADP-dependent 3-hydroxy acid dehydrogenase YdfG